MKEGKASIPGFPSLLAYHFWCFLLRCLYSAVCRVHVMNREKANPKGRWILAANHISHFDPPLLSYAVHRQINWMAMAELFQNPILGYLLRGTGTFPVARGRPDRTSLRTAVARLRAGKVLGLFPDGGIRDGNASILKEGVPRPGLSVVAGLSDAPVVPVVIFGTDRLYNKRRWMRFRSTPLWLGFGDPLPPPGSSPADRENWEAAYLEALRKLANEVAAHFSLSQDDWPKPPAERMKEP
jgi:1-acyl-sn-glycerol-3-phosphate acyltransferase